MLLDRKLDTKLSVVKNLFYISIGSKGVYYTLRKMQVFSSDVSVDSYVCNLSIDKEEAIEKAEAYFLKVKARTSSNIEVLLNPNPEYETSNNIQPKITSYDERLNQIENGVTPIGKYAGYKLEDLPNAYVMWLAEQYTGEFTTNHEEVFQALCSTGLSIAIDRKLFEERQEKIDSSEHIGELGQRAILKNIEITKYDVSISFYGNVLKYTLDIDGKTAIYRGSKYLGVAGDVITLKANIAEHAVLENGFKITYLKRPTLL